MKKMILTMLLTSGTILATSPSVRAIEGVSEPETTINTYENYSIKERLKIDEHDVHSLMLIDSDVLSEIEKFLELDDDRLVALIDSLELEYDIIQKGDELAYIKHEDKIDAILIKVSNDNHDHVYIDLKENKNEDSISRVNDEEYETILNSWKEEYTGKVKDASGDGWVNITPIKEVKGWDKNINVLNVNKETSNEDVSEHTDENTNDDTKAGGQTSEKTDVLPIETVEVENDGDQLDIQDNSTLDLQGDVNSIETSQSDEEVDLDSFEIDDIVDEYISQDRGSNDLTISDVQPEEAIEPEDTVIEESSVEEKTSGVDYHDIAQKNPNNAGLQPHVARFKEEVADKYDVSSFSLYRPGDPQDHGKGLAVDFMVPVGSQKGDDIANYSIEKMKSGEENISYVIWEQRIYGDWSNDWEPMEDRGSITENHYDHVHVSFNP